TGKLSGRGLLALESGGSMVCSCSLQCVYGGSLFEGVLNREIDVATELCVSQKATSDLAWFIP
ncbi:MAG: hypothetical protein WCK28_10815, partial [Burkholderiales bacterium]